VIRNAVLHLANEQPLLADLFEIPRSSDTGLVCTNLRTTAGARPIFVDKSESIFFFPYGFVRFVEVPPGTAGPPALGPGAASHESAPAPGDSASAPGDSASAGAEGAPDPAEKGPTPAADHEIDEDFLRRVREA
jgi:hypothetical protein